MKVKTKRHICAIISLIGFMIMLGAIGSIECNRVDLNHGCSVASIGILIFVAAAYKGGYIN